MREVVLEAEYSYIREPVYITLLGCSEELDSNVVENVPREMANHSKQRELSKMK